MARHGREALQQPNWLRCGDSYASHALWFWCCCRMPMYLLGRLELPKILQTNTAWLHWSQVFAQSSKSAQRCTQRIVLRAERILVLELSVFFLWDKIISIMWSWLVARSLRNEETKSAFNQKKISVKLLASGRERRFYLKVASIDFRSLDQLGSVVMDCGRYRVTFFRFSSRMKQNCWYTTCSTTVVIGTNEMLQRLALTYILQVVPGTAHLSTVSSGGKIGRNKKTSTDPEWY